MSSFFFLSGHAVVEESPKGATWLGLCLSLQNFGWVFFSLIKNSVWFFFFEHHFAAGNFGDLQASPPKKKTKKKMHDPTGLLNLRAQQI